MIKKSRNSSRYAQLGKPILYAVTSLLSLSLVGYLLYSELYVGVKPEALPQAVTTEVVPVSSAANENEIRAYSVPASHPRKLAIPAIGVDALVKPMGVNTDGALQAPTTAWDAGWYKKSGLPGQDGAMLIDGHVRDTYSTLGVFGRLKELKVGDALSIERGDKTVIGYEVVNVEQVAASDVDMKKMLLPIEGSQGLNLITCGGAYDKKSGSYIDRVLVFAKRV